MNQAAIVEASRAWLEARERYAAPSVSQRPTDALSYRVGRRPILVTAFHATPPVRQGAVRHAETDSGALAEALHEAYGYSCLTLVGPQSGDANWDDVHPGRAMTADVLDEHEMVIDLHMMRDEHGPEVCLGLGPAPDARSGRLAALAAFEAESLGVWCSINWPFPANPRTLTAFVQAEGGTALQVEFAIRLCDVETSNTGRPRLLQWWDRFDQHLLQRTP